MERRIAAYLAQRMLDARDIVVDDFARIHGGSSQETYRFRARWRDGDGEIERRLILRREPPGGLVVAERDLEYAVYRALESTAIPVPRAYFLELDPVWLDRPFFIMDLSPGQPGHPYRPGDPYLGHGETIGQQFWHHLGKLAAIDHRAVGLDRLRNGKADGHYWSRELDHWEAVLDAGEAIVEPIVRGALRWLRRNPPPETDTPSIVHGDYRSGNFLFTPDGTLSAILDWELCHVGDPLEDVAWALDPFWPMTRHLPLEEGLAIWEKACGRTIDRAALDWWRLFAPLKACAIWTSAEASFDNGSSREMVIAMSGIRGGHFHRGEILRQMAVRGAMG
jgi:aminoglycoside phosphotransferase (APT) family kinase protein